MLLFVDKSGFINYSHYEFGKMFVARITLLHPCLVKCHKHVTEQLTSNTVSADFPRVWMSSFEYMQVVCVLEHITFCSLFTKCLRPCHNFNYQTVTSNKTALALLIEDMRCSAEQSLAVGACNDLCVFLRHIANMFAPLFGKMYSDFWLNTEILY